MTAGTGLNIPRSAPFLAFNIAIVLFAAIFVLAPTIGHFTSRSEEIAESAAQLAHFRKLARSVGSPANMPLPGADPFLPGGEERVVSADLQAGLKSIANSAGVNLLGIRGLPGSRHQKLRMVAVSVELEGTLPALRDMIVAVENQTPFLFVTAASFRSIGEGEDGPVRAELRVQGAMSDSGPSGEAGAK